ncbi:MAG: hypothetical protein AAFZ65_01215 [Planctomycetota bacterium]
MATDASPTPDSETAAPARERGAVWAALDEAVRTGVTARVGWWLGLVVPTFAIRLLLDDSPAVIDKLGHFNPMPEKSRLGFDGTVLLAPLGVVMSLVWIRIQGQALAGLLIGLDRRVDALREDSEVTGGRLFSAASPIAGDCFWILTARYVLGLLTSGIVFAIPGVFSVVVEALDGSSIPIYLLLGILVAIGFLYLAVLEVATNLAMVSVVANRRGPVSAFQHAWKLMTAEPREALRAGLAHFAIILAVTALLRTVGLQLGGGAETIALFLLAMSSGVAHACLWDRVYSVLGGVRSLPPLPLDKDAGKPAKGQRSTAPASA